MIYQKRANQDTELKRNLTIKWLQVHGHCSDIQNHKIKISRAKSTLSARTAKLGITKHTIFHGQCNVFNLVYYDRLNLYLTKKKKNKDFLKMVDKRKRK